MKIKKYISAIVASVMAMSAFPAVSASAESYGDNIDVMVLGDSIASGTGLGENEYTYGSLIADYLGGNVYNYAVSGHESWETLEVVKSFSDEQKKQLAECEVVIISVGANDMISYLVKALLNFAVKYDLLKDGKTGADIPEYVGFNTLTEFLDMDAVSEFAGNLSNAMLLTQVIDTSYNHITYTDANNNGSAYKQVIAKQIIPNIKAVAAEAKVANPDVRVVVQTVYNPMQFSKEYEAHIKESTSTSYFLAYGKISALCKNVTRRFSEQIKEVEGIEIADVHKDFSSTDENSVNYGYYFTKAQSGRENFDPHPTQAGHIAIASTILNTLGEKREDGGLLKMTFDKLADGKDYPAYALEQYKKIAGSYCLGDVNEDGQIDSSDASAILEQYSFLSTGKNTTISENQVKAGKVTSDNVLDSSDASTVLGYYAFISTGGKGSIKKFMAE